MQQYFFIPLEYEPILTQVLDNWDGWTIITPFYNSTTNDKTEGITTAYNVDRLTRTKEHFFYIIKTELDSSYSYLQAFILEGDLQEYAPQFLALLKSLPNVKIFDDNISILEFLNNIL